MLDTSARLLSLLSLLTARRSWSGADLAERLSVTPRTVRRDVERLRSLGYPVHATSGPAGGYALRPGSRPGLPPLLLDDDAAVAVAVGLRSVAAGPVVGMEEAALRAAAAVEQVLPARLRHQVESLHATALALPAQAPAVDAALLGVLAAACRDGERVRFSYTSRDGDPSRRHVEPHRLVSTGRRWYLVARDVDRDDWRSFRVDRVEAAEPTGRRSRPADPPDAVRFVQRATSFRPYRWRARVLVEAPASVVADRVPPTAGVVEAAGTDRALVETGSDSLDALALHLGMLDLPFVVLEPDELRRHLGVVAQRLRTAAELPAPNPPAGLPAGPSAGQPPGPPARLRPAGG